VYGANRVQMVCHSVSLRVAFTPSSGCTTAAENFDTASTQAGFKPSVKGNGLPGATCARGKEAISAELSVRSFPVKTRYSFSSRFKAGTARGSKAARRHRVK